MALRAGAESKNQGNKRKSKAFALPELPFGVV
jgi:hypothetical protein